MVNLLMIEYLTLYDYQLMRRSREEKVYSLVCFLYNTSYYSKNSLKTAIQLLTIFFLPKELCFFSYKNSCFLETAVFFFRKRAVFENSCFSKTAVCVFFKTVLNISNSCFAVFNFKHYTVLLQLRQRLHQSRHGTKSRFSPQNTRSAKRSGSRRFRFAMRT